ncbi:MAG: GntR family transcriptional regulator [Candidatus Puniceispirillaceae bacterium]
MRKGPSLSKIISESDVQVAPRKSLREDTADALRELILLEKLTPGTSVPERDLAEAMGISRTPMREAMRMLESEGLIEYSRTRRPYIANPTFSVIRQNLLVLGTLEALAGELACTDASDKDLENITSLNSFMQENSDNADALTFFKVDMNFHRAIVEASGNAPLIETHRLYNARLFRSRFVSSRMHVRRDNTLTQHQKITDALLSRNKNQAAIELRAHLETAIENIGSTVKEDDTA